ncbi:MAG: ATP-binding cassette domain-containing protein [Chloroflexi bacterium]|nr:ATP-binding cassette domain-containing protein [Chloroflexota bacterium]
MSGPAVAVTVAAEPKSKADRPGMGYLFKQSISYLRPYRGLSALAFGAMLIEVGFVTLFPVGVKLLLDNAVSARDDRQLVLILAGLCGFFFAASVAGVARDRLSAAVGNRMLTDLRLRMFSHLQRLSPAFFAQAQIGDLVARFAGDLGGVEEALTSAFPRVIRAALMGLVSLVLLFVLDWRLALVTVLVLPLTAVGPKIFGGRAAQAGHARRTDEARLAAIAQEHIAGQLVVRAFGLQGTAQADFQRQLTVVGQSSVRASFMTRLVERAIYISTMGGQLIVTGVGLYLAFVGVLTVGSLVGFLGALINLGGALRQVSEHLPAWLQASGGLQRVDELLNEQPHVVDRPGAVPLPRFAEEIRFDDVTFSYSGEQPNLREVSFRIPAGQLVAFVGRSGSGKSTVLNLMLRFYDPDTGKVIVDGHDLRDVPVDSLRAQIGAVFQDTFLFNVSVGDNIRMGRPSATDAEVEAAAKQAQIHELVASLPEGYGTVVGERGSRLSGGQRQRIALARALLRDPVILVLDEATSALDPGTEAAFNATLEELRAGRTVISVTHRLAGIVNADTIFVMDEGRLVEQGTHEQLLQLGGSYYTLWQQQLGFDVSHDGKRAEVAASRLRAVPLFASVSEGHLEAVADRFVTERFAEGATIATEGDEGDKFYIIVRGSVAVTKASPTGEQRQLAVLQPGDFFGEIALVEDVPRTATIRARTPCILLALARDQFLNLMRSEPELRAAIAQIVAAREEQIAALR